MSHDDKKGSDTPRTDVAVSVAHSLYGKGTQSEALIGLCMQLEREVNASRSAERAQPALGTTCEGMRNVPTECILPTAKSEIQLLAEAYAPASSERAQFNAMAWGDRIRDEQLDELLARAEKSHTVLLRIDQFRDLVLQAKSPNSAIRASVPEGWALVPEELDALQGWKAYLHGDWSVRVDEEGHEVIIPWDTIKQMHHDIVVRSQRLLARAEGRGS